MFLKVNFSIVVIDVVFFFHKIHSNNEDTDFLVCLNSVLIDIFGRF